MRLGYLGCVRSLDCVTDTIQNGLHLCMGAIEENGVPVEGGTKSTTKHALTKTVNRFLVNGLKRVPDLGCILEHPEKIRLLP